MNKENFKLQISQIVSLYARNPFTLQQALHAFIDSYIEKEERVDFEKLSLRFCMKQHPEVEPSGLICKACFDAVVTRMKLISGILPRGDSSTADGSLVQALNREEPKKPALGSSDDPIEVEPIIEEEEPGPEVEALRAGSGGLGKDPGPAAETPPVGVRQIRPIPVGEEPVVSARRGGEESLPSGKRGVYGNRRLG